MKSILRFEEMVQFLACLITMVVIDAPVWTYPLLLLGPDIGMLGYLIDPRIGAMTYNLLHHKAIAVLIGALVPFLGHEFDFDGPWFHHRSVFILTGLILYGHASMDRIFGYGLKFGDSFHHTHLGWIGKREA